MSDGSTRDDGRTITFTDRDDVYVREYDGGSRSVVYTTASYKAAVYAATMAQSFESGTPVVRDVDDDVWDRLQRCGIPQADSPDLDRFRSYPESVQDWICEELLT